MPRRATVLIADNDEANVQLLTDICTAEQMDVLVAVDGAETLARAHEDTPDLVLLDVMMPEKDGFEVLQELRAAPATRALPVIMVTAVSDDDSVRQGYQMGANDYITKPFKVAELVARMRSLVEASVYRQMAAEVPAWGVGDRGQLDAALQQARAATAPCAIIVCRLDDLSQLAGEHPQRRVTRAVEQLALRLRLQVRGVDSAYRVDERTVVVLLEATDPEGAAAVQRRLADQARQPVEVDRHALQLSCGFSVHALEGERTVEEVLREALPD